MNAECDMSSVYAATLCLDPQSYRCAKSSSASFASATSATSVRVVRPIVMNETDAQRAEIVRRFRLYSCQPDEMITFRSLSRMKPGSGDFDPRFYQYGGLWVYPVGALLKAGSLFGIVTLRGDLAYYLDHPEQFARFYIVARLYAAQVGQLAEVHQQRRVRQLAATWLAAHDRHGAVRFDVAAITGVRIEVFEAAF